MGLSQSSPLNINVVSKTAIEWATSLPQPIRAEYFSLVQAHNTRNPHKAAQTYPKLSRALVMGLVWPKDNFRFWAAIFDNAAKQEDDLKFTGAYRWATIISH